MPLSISKHWRFPLPLDFIVEGSRLPITRAVQPNRMSPKNVTSPCLKSFLLEVGPGHLFLRRWIVYMNLAMSTFSPVGLQCSNGMRLCVCVCVCVCTLAYISVHSVLFQCFTDTSTRILKPSEDNELTSLKVDTAMTFQLPWHVDSHTPLWPSMCSIFMCPNTGMAANVWNF